MGQLLHKLDDQRQSNSVRQSQIIPVKGCDGAIVDEEDFAVVSKYRWRLFDNKHGNRYAQTTGPNNSTIRMHRMILGLSDGRVFVDHKNGDGLDNRRENLRTCTHSQNVTNKRKLKTGGALRTGNGWVVRVTRMGVRHYFGYFTDREEAMAVYAREARRIHGEFSPV